MKLRRPEVLFDREQEWLDLATLLGDRRPGLHLGVVTGRRRQGKSFLLRALANASGGLYHQAQELERPQALARFADDVARSRGLVPGALAFSNWDIALRTALGYPARGQLPESTPGGPALLVIDELPYLLANSPELPSVLQELHDEAAASSLAPRAVVVCGSALSVMSDLLSGSKPLHGRAQLSLILRPFGYLDAARYWGITNPEVAFMVDAIFGGTAGYRALVEQPPPATPAGLSAWLARSALNPAHALFNERDYLLREDPRITDKQLYNSILSAVAEGAHTPSQIGASVARDSNRLRHPLEVLHSAGFLERAEDTLVMKRPTYRIADPIVRFSEVVTTPYQVLLEQRDVKVAWAAAQPAFGSRILGPHFERLCREWTSANPAQWPESVGVVGSAVVSDPSRRTQHELDVVALARGDRAGGKHSKVIVLGEAKAGNQRRSVADLNRLRAIQQVLLGRGVDAGGAVLAVFGRGGFDAGLRAAAQRDPSVRLVSLNDLYTNTQRRA